MADDWEDFDTPASADDAPTGDADDAPLPSDDEVDAALNAVAGELAPDATTPETIDQLPAFVAHRALQLDERQEDGIADFRLLA